MSTSTNIESAFDSASNDSTHYTNNDTVPVPPVPVQPKIKTSKKGKPRPDYNWKLINILTNVELETFIRQGKYKFVRSHSSFGKRVCTIDDDHNDSLPNTDGHKMNHITFKCSSGFCMKPEDAQCPFQYQARFCLNENKNFFYQVKLN
jgi:hypothetical protein